MILTTTETTKITGKPTHGLRACVSIVVCVVYVVVEKKTWLLLGKESSSMELTLGLPKWQFFLFGMVVDCLIA